MECKTCMFVFGKKVPDGPLADGVEKVVFQCRRNPPNVVIDVLGIQITRSPKVTSDFWCGEHKTTMMGIADHQKAKDPQA